MFPQRREIFGDRLHLCHRAAGKIGVGGGEQVAERSHAFERCLRVRHTPEPFAGNRAKRVRGDSDLPAQNTIQFTREGSFRFDGVNGAHGA